MLRLRAFESRNRSIILRRPFRPFPSFRKPYYAAMAFLTMPRIKTAHR